LPLQKNYHKLSLRGVTPSELQYFDLQNDEAISPAQEANFVHRDCFTPFLSNCDRLFSGAGVRNDIPTLVS
jgi:hypothetical protein